jgi:hypothetical protein
VKREKYPTKHRYVFELMVDIDSAVGLSAGELAALVVEGLFALDQQGVLFPGLTTPEHRLITVCLCAIAYSSWGRAAPVDKAYRRIIKSQPIRDKRDFEYELESAFDGLSAVILRQRMLMAIIRGLANKCRHPTAFAEADGTRAFALIAAAEAIIAAVETSAKPVL